MANTPLRSLDFIINHVVLPPKLPQEAEEPELSRAAERDLVGLVSTQLEGYRSLAGHQTPNARAGWLSIKMMLDRCTLLLSPHALVPSLLVGTFRSLGTESKSCFHTRNIEAKKDSQPTPQPSLSISELKMRCSSCANARTRLPLSATKLHRRIPQSLPPKER